MVMVHFGPSPVPGTGLASLAYDSTHGRASILFVVLAGVGVSLLAGDRTPSRLRSAWLRLGWRCLVLLPMGLVLQPLDHGVLVILQYYAVYFLVAAAALPLADRSLLALAVVIAAVAPVVYVGAQMGLPAWFESGGPAALGDEPAQIARDLLLTGSYPVLTWSGPVLFGVWLGRRDLRAAGTRWRLVAGGVGVAAAAAFVSVGLEAVLGASQSEASWRQLVTAEAHGQMPLWLVGSTGVATAVVGAVLALTDRAPRPLWPLVAMGQLAFTVYVGHLLVLAAAPDLLVRETVAGAAASVARFTVVAAALCVLWRVVFARGPLEVVLRAPWMWRPRRVPRQPTPGPSDG